MTKNFVYVLDDNSKADIRFLFTKNSQNVSYG